MGEGIQAIDNFLSFPYVKEKLLWKLIHCKPIPCIHISTLSKKNNCQEYYCRKYGKLREIATSTSRIQNTDAVTLIAAAILFRPTMSGVVTLTCLNSSASATVYR